MHLNYSHWINNDTTPENISKPVFLYIIPKYIDIQFTIKIRVPLFICKLNSTINNNNEKKYKEINEIRGYLITYQLKHKIPSD